MHARFSSAESITVIEQIFVLHDSCGLYLSFETIFVHLVDILGIQPSKIQKLPTGKSNFEGKIVENEIFPNDPNQFLRIVWSLLGHF